MAKSTAADDRDIGPGDMIQVMLPNGELHTIWVDVIGIRNGFPIIHGRDEVGNGRSVEPGWVLRA